MIVTPINLQNVRLEWDVPQDNNAPITNYTIMSWRVSSGSAFPLDDNEVIASSALRQNSQALDFPFDSLIRVLIVANNNIGSGQQSQQTFEFNTSTPGQSVTQSLYLSVSRLASLSVAQSVSQSAQPISQPLS